MLNSMTGFACKEASFADLNVTHVWEIKSVNHRYLELNFKLPDQVRCIESELRQILKQYIRRGKVEINLKIMPNQNTPQTIQIDSELIQALAHSLSEIDQLTHHKLADYNGFEFLRWPGVISNQQSINNDYQAQTIKIFEQACKQLHQSRVQEGIAITAMIEQRLVNIEKLTRQVTQLIPEIQKTYQQKITEQLQTVTVQADPQRLEQEIIFYLQKTDIYEELDRLQVHVYELKKQLTAQSPVGRRLDFILQEINREVNTLGSKTFSAEISSIVIELKVLIEQIREQVQNVE